MTNITYIGVFDVVEFEQAPGIWVTCEQGATVEVPDALAKSLLDQPENWLDPSAPPAPAKPKRARKAAAKTTDGDIVEED